MAQTLVTLPPSPLVGRFNFGKQDFSVKRQWRRKTMKTNAKPSAARNFSSLSLCICLFFVLSIGLHGIKCPAQNAVVVVGSGSSVPAPLYTRWAQEYDKRNATIQLRYLPVGTSEGIRQISRGAGDFAAGEAQLTEAQRKEGNLIEIPVVLIGIVPVYNLSSVHTELRLSGEVLAAIFMGDIKMWNAAQIARLNPDVALPSLPIRVVNRPAGKGTNYVFTDFLSKVSPKFKAQIGVSPSPKWPVGEAAERSSDMADKVKSTPGAIGYVEYQYAVKDSISQAAVLNASGKFIRASAESIAAACHAVEAPQWNKFSASLTNAAGAESYPISSFTWLYVPLKPADTGRAAALNDLLDWMYSDGQRYAVQEGYPELPPPLLAAVKKKISELQ
jgi:phosphate transport system substrate-binding protein